MGEKVLEETQEGSHSRKIMNTAGESREELRSMIRQVIAVEFGSILHHGAAVTTYCLRLTTANWSVL